MNIALPALLTFLLLLPGILLSYSYRRGFFSPSRVTLGPLRDEIAVGIVLGLVIHPFAITFASGIALWEPDVFFLYEVFAGATAELGQGEEWRALGLFYYLILVNLGCLFAGWGAHFIVRKFYLDILFEWLRFDNEWHYNFSGEARLFSAADEEDGLLKRWKDIRRESKTELLRIHCTAIVVVQDQSFVYGGRLSRYYFDEAGRLDCIVLQEVERVALQKLEEAHNVDTSDASGGSVKSDEPDQVDWFSIPGDFLVIRYTNVKTLNFDYAVIDPLESG